jgi:ketosteroid isomerase-like protein
MRSYIERGAIVLVLAMVAAACSQAPQAPPRADRGAIKSSIDSLNAAFLAAVSSRDTEAVVSFYSDDARILAPGMARVDGRDGARRVWVGMLRTPGLALELNSRDLVTSDSGDLVIDVGEYTMKSQGGESVVTDVGKYVTAFKKVGGQWKIIVDTFNSDGPTPAPESSSHERPKS